MEKIMKNFTLCTCFIALFTSLSSLALEKITGNVTLVEASYMPQRITFIMDAGSASCPAGSWFKWQKTPENNQVVYSTLITSLVSGKKVNFYVADGNTQCHGAYIHLISK
ncbi:hypothetical protein AAOGI_41340 [Agarivorans albus]